MFDEVIVPLDGSEEAARALRPATAVTHRIDGTMRVVSFHPESVDPTDLRMEIQRQIRDVGHVPHTFDTIAATKTVAEHLEDMVAESPDALVVMSTRGHGRSAAIIGSVANHLLATTHRPVLLVGPACTLERFRMHGPLVIATDSSDYAEAALDIAAWAVESFEYEPSVVNVVDPASTRVFAAATSQPSGSDLPQESAMVQRFAHDLGERTGRVTNFEVLHDPHPGKAIARYADNAHASLVAMATHARSGFDRLKEGSVTADVLHSVSCPVLAISPVQEEAS